MVILKTVHEKVLWGAQNGSSIVFLLKPLHMN